MELEELVAVYELLRLREVWAKFVLYIGWLVSLSRASVL